METSSDPPHFSASLPLSKQQRPISCRGKNIYLEQPPRCTQENKNILFSSPSVGWLYSLNLNLMDKQPFKKRRRRRKRRERRLLAPHTLIFRFYFHLFFTEDAFRRSHLTLCYSWIQKRTIFVQQSQQSWTSDAKHSLGVNARQWIVSKPGLDAGLMNQMWTMCGSVWLVPPTTYQHSHKLSWFITWGNSVQTTWLRHPPGDIAGPLKVCLALVRAEEDHQS